ncbi:ABC-type branched-subunit amino acid transport system ATPase component [Bradyrhizobium sp. LB9.1b]
MAEQHTTMLSLRGLTRRFGGLTAVDAVDLDLAKGELISIIGPNGAGKTTLFNLVTGLDRPDAGTVHFEGQDTSRVFRRSGWPPKVSRARSSSAASSAISASWTTC